MAEILANGVRLHVQRIPPSRRTAGDAPTVVMLHGMIMDNISAFYFGLGNCLAAAGCDVICYDLRGHGRSERTRDGYTMAESIADLRGLLDALGVDRPVHLVGNSYGATLALAFGLDHADQVESLTLIEPPFLVDGLGEEMARSLEQLLAAMSDQEVEQWLADGAGRAIGRSMRAARALLRETTIGQDMLAIPSFPPARLAGLNVPVLAVYGANSEIVNQAESLVGLMPDCTLTILEHTTHMVLREAADYLRDLMRWWLFRRREEMPQRRAGARFVTPDWVRQMVPPPGLNSARRGNDTVPSPNRA
ncbi:alpha/beta fold hydrolase [Frankia gtarii]|uniref:alpha/beta fold hydrolase n=1 Tax=Frankia gtarii TaxID=2950102 RepID=UPI0021C07932|nr:alpha/beta hydrolase [Frankia gtarii]